MSKKTKIVWGVGFGFLVLYYLPYLILGENTYHRIFDTMDSEPYHNVLFAKYLFSFNKTIPQFMNTEAIWIHKFSFVYALLNVVFPMFAAFILNDLVVRICAFIGMYLLMMLVFEKICKKSSTAEFVISLIVSVLFALLPFFSHFGLITAGIPLLCMGFYWIYKREHLVWAYFVIVFFAFSTSVVLSGFYILPIVFIFAVVLKKNKHAYFAAAAMLGIYIICSIKMLYYSLGGGGYVSHRINWNDPEYNDSLGNGVWNLIKLFFMLIFFGHEHSYGYFGMVLVTLVGCFVGLCFYKTKNFSSGNYLKVIGFIFLIIAAVSLIDTIFTTELFLRVKQKIGIATLHFNRVSIGVAGFYYIAAGFALLIIWRETFKPAIESFLRVLVSILAVSIFLYMGILSVIQTTHYLDYGRLVGYNYDAVPTWKQYYDKKLFQEIGDYIAIPKSEYRVASIAIHPVSALYNGFYNLDGYLSNYPYEYWEKFGRVFEGVDMNDEHKNWWKWGNKCYLLVNEIPMNDLTGTDLETKFGKTSDVKIKNLQLNWEALKDLADNKPVYIFSAVEVLQPEAHGLEFHRTFEHDKSFWRIWLYRVI